jgi:hypothetical protein
MGLMPAPFFFRMIYSEYAFLLVCMLFLLDAHPDVPAGLLRGVAPATGASFKHKYIP